MDRIPEIAAFLADLPGLKLPLTVHVVDRVVRRWGPLSEAEADQVGLIVSALAVARRSRSKTELQYLIEKARLVHGTVAAARLVYAFGVGAARAGSEPDLASRRAVWRYDLTMRDVERWLDRVRPTKAETGTSLSSRARRLGLGRLVLRS